jgi:hypothetical protein
MTKLRISKVIKYYSIINTKNSKYFEKKMKPRFAFHTPVKKELAIIQMYFQSFTKYKEKPTFI